MNPAGRFTRTRIAPTPSGYLHIGNVLSFALTAMLARKTGASILLRIDDLDRERVSDAYVQDIFDTLDFLEIPWDEGPGNPVEFEREYSQIHRLSLYRDTLEELKRGNHVFACDCSRSRLIRTHGENAYDGACRNKKLPLTGDRLSWRLHTPPGEVTLHTVGHGVVMDTLPASVQDFVVRKKDGYPSYQLASVCDDMYFGVDLVVRGEDLYTSTLAQLYLSSLLRDRTFCNTFFYHHPLVSGEDHLKLSKSEGAESVRYLRQQGRRRQEIFSLIGRKLELPEPVNDWQSLAMGLWTDKD